MAANGAKTLEGVREGQIECVQMAHVTVQLRTSPSGNNGRSMHIACDYGTCPCASGCTRWGRLQTSR